MVKKQHRVVQQAQEELKQNADSLRLRLETGLAEAEACKSGLAAAQAEARSLEWGLAAAEETIAARQTELERQNERLSEATEEAAAAKEAAALKAKEHSAKTQALQVFKICSPSRVLMPGGRGFIVWASLSRF
jgi:chromosome segregation ATPase